MATNKTTRFIVSKEKNPKVELKKGLKFEVRSVQLVDVTLKKIKKGGARLCGGTSTCLALIDIGDGFTDPSPIK